MIKKKGRKKVRKEGKKEGKGKKDGKRKKERKKNYDNRNQPMWIETDIKIRMDKILRIVIHKE